MLELRPSCEHCNKPLPPGSLEARICSYECTFCQTCVDEILKNVCPNCGGGFVPRPIRPVANLAKHPASTVVKHCPVQLEIHAARLAQLAAIPPHQR